jgi:acylphosphatase
MDKKVEILIRGKVQGVGFRFMAHLAFVDLGMVGTAENLPDGSVQLVTQGPEDKLERLINWCKRGPEGAQVSDVEVKEEPIS